MKFQSLGIATTFISLLPIVLSAVVKRQSTAPIYGLVYLIPALPGIPTSYPQNAACFTSNGSLVLQQPSLCDYYTVIPDVGEAVGPGNRRREKEIVELENRWNLEKRFDYNMTGPYYMKSSIGWCITSTDTNQAFVCSPNNTKPATEGGIWNIFIPTNNPNTHELRPNTTTSQFLWSSSASSSQASTVYADTAHGQSFAIQVLLE